MAGLDLHVPGDHTLPARFHGPSRAPAKPRRRRTGLILGLTAGAMSACILGGLQLAANLGYDDAAERFDSAVSNTESARGTLRDDAGQLAELSSDTDGILAADSGLLVSADTKAAVADAVDEADDVLTDATATIEAPSPDAASKPLWFWDIYPATAELDGGTSAARDLTDRIKSDDARVRAAGSATAETALALIGEAADGAGAFESAHISAKNDDVIALRDAATSAQDLSEVDQTTVDAFVALDDAAERVVASEQIELAEKSGPLLHVRLEIEAFARSLAPGVLLEFDWNPIVNGAGENGSMGGLTTWWWSTPGPAQIALSNSVAEQWPSISSKSLVAHEVGHAISVKCQGMYDSSTQDSIEKWATAWAISMGYTDDANGVWAYGYPPQSYIDAAAGCR
jgi:hypothetical protein